MCGHALSHSCHVHTSHETRPRHETLLDWHRFWGHTRTPQNLRMYQIGFHLFYAYNIPRSIASSSKVSSGCLSSGGGGVDVHGRDGSGHIKYLTTYGLFNFVPARLCVGASLCIINIISLNQHYRMLTLRRDASTALYEWATDTQGTQFCQFLDQFQ